RRTVHLNDPGVAEWPHIARRLDFARRRLDGARRPDLAARRLDGTGRRPDLLGWRLYGTGWRPDLLGGRLDGTGRRPDFAWRRPCGTGWRASWAGRRLARNRTARGRTDGGGGRIRIGRERCGTRSQIGGKWPAWRRS